MSRETSNTEHQVAPPRLRISPVIATKLRVKIGWPYYENNDHDCTAPSARDMRIDYPSRLRPIAQAPCRLGQLMLGSHLVRSKELLQGKAYRQPSSAPNSPATTSAARLPRATSFLRYPNLQGATGPRDKNLPSTLLRHHRDFPQLRPGHAVPFVGSSSVAIRPPRSRRHWRSTPPPSRMGVSCVAQYTPRLCCGFPTPPAWWGSLRPTHRADIGSEARVYSPPERTSQLPKVDRRLRTAGGREDHARQIAGGPSRRDSLVP